MLDPCEHLIHAKCYKLSKNKNCSICNSEVIKYYNKNQLKNQLKNHKNDPLLYQKYIDIVSVEYSYNLLKHINNNNIFSKLPDVMNLLYCFYTSNNMEGGIHICKKFMELSNCKLIVKGMENYDNNKKKVIICNHINFFDSIPLFYLFQPIFLSSSMIKDYFIYNKIKKMMRFLIFNRKKKKHIVNKMKKYIEKYGSLLLFPGGLCTNSNTLPKFRTGAFYTGYPVCPIVISYKPELHNLDVINIVKLLLSYSEIKITINILPLEEMPFTPEKIDNIRHIMAKVGKMALSRISNRDQTN
jgi:1-acyl-sn-glycerol-3-phosphate acyltransferase